MQISPGELSERLRSDRPPHLLDVRQPEEHALAALPGSRLIPLGDLPERHPEISDWMDADVVVYCHHGIRSAHAIGFLRALGFQRLRNLAGGIDRWSTEVDPGIPRY
jgi:rhodanese-related sulfurtransferase